MIVNRNTTHEALHRAGATLVKCVAPGVFDVTPPINVSLLPAFELEVAREEKLSQLSRSRRAAQELPVTVAGQQFPANSEYREIVSNLVRRKNAGKPIPAILRGANGQPATITPVPLDQIDDAIAASVQAQWDRFLAKFDAVQAATTVDQVNAVVW